MVAGVCHRRLSSFVTAAT